MKRIGLLVGALGLVVAGCGGAASVAAKAPTPSVSAAPTPTPSPTIHRPTRLTVKPIMDIKLGSDSEFPNWKRTTGKKCAGSGGASEDRVGHAVTIYDAAGHRVIGTGLIDHSAVIGKHCDLIATVRGLPREKFYQVQWATGNKIAFSQHDLVTGASVTVLG